MMHIWSDADVRSAVREAAALARLDERQQCEKIARMFGYDLVAEKIKTLRRRSDRDEGTHIIEPKLQF